ncbi:aminodeoxychorismate synthase component I [Dongia soli]|uniref:aminodeoxychorismate synthase n=1 Tax=Dongia soli TaxID=600628 RepID=A0ABU5E4U6_9PROT|nr:aminodeoxychorismate synthase component I [Dongia soli]MDY0881342.1 aminodeoxychorismate synthase component I [Dongia soli]
MKDHDSTDLLVQEISLAALPRDPIAWVQAFADLPGLVFLDSARPGGALGRYSFLAADPIHMIEAKGNQVRLDGAVVRAEDPFQAIQRILRRYPVSPRPDLPPFQTGLAGFFGYDLRHHLEQVPPHAVDDQPFPDLMLGLYDVVLAFDHEVQRCFIMSSGHPAEGAARRQRAQARLDAAIARLRATQQPRRPSFWSIEPQPDLGRERVEAMVRRSIDYIEAGDIYQANVTHRFRAALPVGFDRLALYDALRRRNPATFAAYLDFGDTAILSSSPERFLKLRDGKVETRPIKGTRPRGRTPAEDAAEAAALLASEKDHAENLMIVDLLRNDLSRVCEIGSVKVPVLCGLESYATVHHLVSVVTGTMLPAHDAVDLLRATFPGGSITGAPKIRAMEIIAELEPNRRGPYCGSIGYLGADGSMDTSIVIRTYCILENELSFQVGGGIVADSDPAAEYRETLDKARALIETLRDGDHGDDLARRRNNGTAA